MEYELSEIVNRLINLTDSESSERTLSVSFKSNLETGRADIVVRKEKRLVFDPNADKRFRAKIARNGEVGY